MATSGSPLSTRRKRVTELLLAQLLTGATVEQSAERVGISERTAFRILQDFRVQQEFRELKKGVLERATLKLSSAVDAAIDVLVEISQDQIQPAASRGSCATQIIKQAYLNASLSDLEERLEKLESHLGHKVIDQRPQWSENS